VPVDQRALTSSLQSLQSLAVPGEADDGVIVGILDRVMEAARRVLNVDGIGLMLADGNDHLRVVGTSDAASAALERGQQQLGVGPAIDCVHTDSTVLVADLATSPEYSVVWRWLQQQEWAGGEPPVRAVLSAPVRMAGHVAGTLNTLRSAPEQWTAEHAEAVGAYAGIIAGLLRLATPSGDGLAGPAKPPNGR
jgi:GAF domain-containing protein